jgi:hypothetical protein
LAFRTLARGTPPCRASQCVSSAVMLTVTAPHREQ